MKKILIIKMRFPYPIFSGTDHVSFNLIKALSEEHEVSLICHVRSDENIKDIAVLKQYCKEVIVARYPDIKTVWQRIWKKIKREFFFLFCLVPRDVIDNISTEIEKKIKDHLSSNKYDIVQIEYFYAAKYRKYIKNSMSIILSNDAYYETVRQFYLYEKNIIKKAVRFFEYIVTKRYELRAYKLFDWVFFISKDDLKIIERDNILKQTRVIPVAMEACQTSKEYKIVPYSMVFVGGMQALFNRDAVIYFCRDIYPLIRSEIPEVTFTIVGSSPGEDILEFAKEPGITVTGSVQDVVPYVSKAAIYVAPLRIGTGIKTKILEAMSMKKAIVTTSMGIQGLSVENGKELFIEDDRISFARRVIELLREPEKCKVIGLKAAEYFDKKHNVASIKSDILDAYRGL